MWPRWESKSNSSNKSRLRDPAWKVALKSVPPVGIHVRCFSVKTRASKKILMAEVAFSLELGGNGWNEDSGKLGRMNTMTDLEGKMNCSQRLS